MLSVDARFHEREIEDARIGFFDAELAAVDEHVEVMEDAEPLEERVEHALRVADDRDLCARRVQSVHGGAEAIGHEGPEIELHVALPDGIERCRQGFVRHARAMEDGRGRGRPAARTGDRTLGPRDVEEGVFLVQTLRLPFGADERLGGDRETALPCQSRQPRVVEKDDGVARVQREQPDAANQFRVDHAAFRAAWRARRIPSCAPARRPRT